MKKRCLGARGWGLGDEGLPAAAARQHHSLSLSCGSRKPTNLEKEFPFSGRTMRECYVRPNGADRQWVEVPPR